MGRSASFVLAVALFVSLAAAAASTPPPAALPEAAANDNRAPAGRLESGVLTLHLELREGVWHPEAPDGRAIRAYFFGEEGRELQNPAPLIRVPQGAELRVSVRNRLPVAVSVSGLNQHPGKPDSVLKLAPGEVKETTFTAGEPGSYIYSASTPKEGERVGADGTMAGAFIVDPPDATIADHVFVLQLREHGTY